VWNSAFYGVMIDESTKMSITGHLVVFASIVEEGLPVTLFLGLLEIEEGKKDTVVIYETLISSIRKWGSTCGNSWDLEVTVLAPWWAAQLEWLSKSNNR